MTQAPSIRWLVTSKTKTMVEHASQEVYAESLGRPCLRQASAAGRTPDGRLPPHAAGRSGRLAAAPCQLLADLTVRRLPTRQRPPLPRPPPHPPPPHPPPPPSPLPLPPTPPPPPPPPL